MSLLDEKQRNAVLRTLNELRRAAPAKPGEQYGAPAGLFSVACGLGGDLRGLEGGLMGVK